MDLVSQSVTVSLLASSSSLTSLTIELYHANSFDTFGTWGSPSLTTIGTQNVTISSTEQRVSATFTLPSSATTGLELRITGGALLASQTLTIGDVQLEGGTVASNFERRPISVELAACQRYYEFTNFSMYSPIASGTNVMIRGFAVWKRVSPTLITNSTFTANVSSASFLSVAQDFYRGVIVATSGGAAEWTGTVAGNAEFA